VPHCRNRNLVANTEQFKAYIPLRDGEEVVVTALPLYHIFALMVNFLTMFSVGAENSLVANARDADSLVDTLKHARPTVFMGVNTLYAGLTLHPRLGEVDWSRLQLAGGGGAAVIARDPRPSGCRSPAPSSARLRPLGDVAGPVVQPDLHERVQRQHRPTAAVDRHQAAR